jgi:hypothetical protein
MGVAIGLPWLEAMLPLPARAAEDARPVLRSVFIYKPGGIAMPSWTPKGEGKDFELSSSLSPLKDLKDDVLVLSGLDMRNGENGANGHPVGSAPWLSSAPINQKDVGGYATAVSVDQLIARKIGAETRLASLELSCCAEPGRFGLHTTNISWRAPGSPMGIENKPRAVFARLFGDPGSDKQRKSILDLVQGEARQLRSDLGSADRHRVDEYLDTVRAVEQRIQIAEQKKPKEKPPELNLPAGVPPDYPQHVELMFDLLFIALQADCTRVATFMLAAEDGIPPLPHVGDTVGSHGLWHSNRWPEVSKIDRWYVTLLARMLEKMKAVREGNGTLLDNSMVLFGSGLSSGHSHSRKDLPIILAGRAGGTITAGRHLRYPQGTPFANLFLSMLDRYDVKLERIADSTARLPQLSAR